MARRKTPSVDFATRFLLCLACRQGLGREFVPYLKLLCTLARVDWVYDCDKYVQISRGAGILNARQFPGVALLFGQLPSFSCSCLLAERDGVV